MRDLSKTISVALDVVTLVGLLGKGVATFSNMLLKNCLISELWWNSKQFKSKSPVTKASRPLS